MASNGLLSCGTQFCNSLPMNYELLSALKHFQWRLEKDLHLCSVRFWWGFLIWFLVSNYLCLLLFLSLLAVVLFIAAFIFLQLLHFYVPIFYIFIYCRCFYDFCAVAASGFFAVLLLHCFYIVWFLGKPSRCP